MFYFSFSYVVIILLDIRIITWPHHSLQHLSLRFKGFYTTTRRIYTTQKYKFSPVNIFNQNYSHWEQHKCVALICEFYHFRIIITADQSEGTERKFAELAPFSLQSHRPSHWQVTFTGFISAACQGLQSSSLRCIYTLKHQSYKQTNRLRQL